jgi:hypothetical protein
MRSFFRLVVVGLFAFTSLTCTLRSPPRTDVANANANAREPVPIPRGLGDVLRTIVAVLATTAPPADDDAGVADGGEGEGEGEGAGEGEGEGEGEGACAMVELQVPEEGHNHVDAGQLVTYGSNPPATGSHWPIWAKYMIHDEDVPPEVFVHNLEHGAILFLVGPNTPSDIVDALKSVYENVPVDIFCLQYQSSNTGRALFVTDPDLDDVVAVVAWDHVLSGNCVDSDRIMSFIQTYRGATAEQICADGAWPYPPGVWPDHINDVDGGSGMNQPDAGP